MSEKQNGHRKRVRERYLKEGIENFQPYEVLELLLQYSVSRRDTKATAKELIETFGSIENVFQADIENLQKCDGVGEKTAIFINLLEDIIRYRKRECTENQKMIRNIEEAGIFAVNYLSEFQKEIFCIVLLDVRKRIIKTEKISEGGLDFVSFDIRSVIEKVARHGKTASVILMHNHPSRNKKPSNDDINVTTQIMKLLMPLGISVDDHIIVAADEFVSMNRQGFM